MEEALDKTIKIIATYKPAKTTDEMVEKLYNEKSVRYNTISKIEAKEILLRYNYINVISPFKHHFAKQTQNGMLVKIDGNHVYENDVEFSEYFDLYEKERSVYPNIYANISTFETHFKAITGYHIFNDLKDKINTSEDLESFLTKINISIALKSEYKDDRKVNMSKRINELIKNILNYHDVYCFFDRMSLGDLLIIYIGLDSSIQQTIFDEMSKYKQNLDASSPTQFISRTFKLVGIRNYIMHNNSLEILIRFYDPKDKTSLRKSREREAYKSLIKDLSKEK